MNEPPSLIFDSKNSSSKIQLFEKDTVPISRNVYLLTGSIWNSGDFPITKEDVRIPISLNLKKTNRILDFKITKQRDSSISGFVLNKFEDNSLQLGWNYFDPGFGFAFQIIYEGDINHNFEPTGKVLDISEFKNEQAKPPGKSYWYFQFFVIIVSSIVVFGSIIYDIKSQNRIQKITWAFTGMIVFLILYNLWLYLFGYNISTPI